jgi:chromosome segregation and condensation protein ScpB
VLGKPLLYATTKSFLADLGLRSLNELPPIPSEKIETGSSNEDEILI